MTRFSYFFLMPALLMATTASAAPVGTAFNYQGELTVSSAPANGPFDFEFALYNVAGGGGAIDTVVQDDVAVSGGLFSVELDYTDVPFSIAEAYFLEVRVRDGASGGGHTQLLPRQRITPTPYAINARSVQDGGVTQNAIASGAVGNAQLANSAVTNAKLADASISTPKLADASVTNAKVANGSITESKIGNGSISNDKLADDGVTESKIVDSSITNAKLATGSITSNKLANASVTNAKLADTSITDNKIANGTITAGKLAFTPGDVTAVVAGIGLTGGGSGGDLALSIDTSVVQTRISGSCALGSYLRGINVDGSALCSDLPGVTTITTVDDPDNSVGEHTSIAVPSDGLPLISYRDVTARTLMVAKCTNASCTGAATITTVDSANDVGWQTSIAFGSDDLPVISYRDNTDTALKVAKCANAACTGNSTITTVDNSSSDGSDSSIAIGDDGLPVISYIDLLARALKVAKCSNAACTGSPTITTVDDPANNIGGSTSIAIGSDALPVISYRDESAGTLKVAKCINAACTGSSTITTVDTAPFAFGAYTSIAIGSDDLPVISYLATGNALKVAKCSNAACTAATITTVDNSANQVGFFTSIAIGGDGMPVIGYLDKSASAVKVAKCSNPACTGAATITTVDDPPNFVGRFIAIALGSDGLPVISYQDFSANSLKVAKCGSPSCR